MHNLSTAGVGAQVVQCRKNFLARSMMESQRSLTAVTKSSRMPLSIRVRFNWALAFWQVLQFLPGVRLCQLAQ